MAAPPSHLFHWPGGIPPEIQVDGNDNTREQVDEEAQAISNIHDEDGDYEVRQRRALEDTWAKASQDFP
ncbi:hypothetical protein IFM46972_11298 [Aspergillus udagawae]|uniref:Uncharacterized protein n=1 Tax=Aspergillus udagawae TaxID=91492 RepID=A0A8H3SFY0_9EURO|nr:hypothetical protein IFM46972_11298 [Aspergillus udagawae]